ncbi:MAG: hypothetical protein AAF433_07835 [Bacteroidota bacterium]
MKNSCTLSLIILGLFCLTPTANAQLVLKQISASFGFDQDMLNDMSGSYLIDAGQQDQLTYDYSEMNLEPTDAYSWICENPHLRLMTTWVNPKAPNVEYGANLLLISNRIDEMSYRGEYTGLGQHNYLNISQTSNEVAAEATIGYRLRGSRVFNLVGFAGVNAGYHWGDVYIRGNVPVCNDNQVIWRSGTDTQAPCPSEYVSDVAAADGGISLRAFAGVKGSITIAQRLELGITFRRGVGLRTVGEAQTQGTTLMSHSLSMGWNLFR